MPSQHTEYSSQIDLVTSRKGLPPPSANTPTLTELMVLGKGSTDSANRPLDSTLYSSSIESTQNQQTKYLKEEEEKMLLLGSKLNLPCKLSLS